MIATELGGGGGVDPEITDATERGLMNCLAHLGVIGDAPELVDARRVEITSPMHTLYAPGAGVFDRAVRRGAGCEGRRHLAGRFHFVMEPERASVTLPVSNGWLCSGAHLPGLCSTRGTAGACRAGRFSGRRHDQFLRYTRG